MCREFIVPGNLRRIDWKDDDTVGRMVMKGLRLVCHITMVPPWALDLVRERSSIYVSSELRWQSYLPLNGNSKGGRSL